MTKTCKHSWTTEVIHFNFGEPVIRARCSQCKVLGSESRNRWHELLWLLPRAGLAWLVLLLLICVIALALTAVIHAVYAIYTFIH